MPEKDLLSYHIEHTDKRFDKVDEKLDRLNAFMLIVIISSIAFSSTGSKIFEIAAAFAGVIK